MSLGWFKKRQTEAVDPEGSRIRSQSIREFVYLDEVSVYTLTSSPDKPPASAMSETSNFEAGTDYGTDASVGSKHLARAGTHAKFTSKDASGLEIQRRFNVQSLFAVLHREYSGEFRLRSPGVGLASLSSPQHGDIDRPDLEDVAEHLLALERGQRAVRVDDLRRGDLIEVPIILDAHPLFSIVTTARAIGDLIDKGPAFAGSMDANSQDGLQFALALQDLMIDLVPIEGVASQHRLVTIDGEEWIIEQDALRDHPQLRTISRPLRIAGVTEVDRYWKDTRRVLHADQDYDVLARVSNARLESGWAPIKMLQAFRKAVPGAGDSLATMISSLPAIISGEAAQAGEPPESRAAVQLLSRFQDHYGVSVSEEHALTYLVSVGPVAPEDIEGGLSALRRGLDVLHELIPDLPRDVNAEGEMRQEVWQQMELFADATKDSEDVIAGQPPPADLLEVEFIGIYW